jgi:serine/threonine protein kinase
VRKTKAKPDETLNTILQAGQLVNGNYRVDHLLGEGGMAAVWAGTNERTGKRVALKVILRSLATTPEAQRLFQTEAVAASRVNHPNVVTVFDVIEHEGMACIVMELLDGEPLGSYIARKGFLSIGEAAALLLPAMRGVAAAHAQGVIHRDLKPQNIFICIGPDGRIVTTKVLDFGISVMVERVIDPAAGPRPALAMGTPAYMSPEHVLGAAQIDGRADVYGFGVLLYEALTGQMPFPGEPGPDLFHRILNEPAPKVTLFRPDLPAGLVRIIDVAMAKDPDHRYSDLNLMVSALEDELLPNTPLPRSLTPLAGVVSFASHNDEVGASVQAIEHREPSTPHQETILYCARLPEGEKSEPSVSIEEPRATPKLVALPAGGEVAKLQPSLLRLPLSGLRGLLAGRGWQAWVGAGVAVGLVLGLWVTRRPSRLAAGMAPVVQTAPPKRQAAPAQLEPQSTHAPVPTLTSNSISASPSAAETLASGETGKLRNHRHGLPVIARHSRVAAREPWRESTRQQGMHAAQGDEAVLSPPPVTSTPRKSTVPRAGGLSEDDF